VVVQVGSQRELDSETARELVQGREVVVAADVVEGEDLETGTLEVGAAVVVEDHLVEDRKHREEEGRSKVQIEGLESVQKLIEEEVRLCDLASASVVVVEVEELVGLDFEEDLGEVEVLKVFDPSVPWRSCLLLPSLPH